MPKYTLKMGRWWICPQGVVDSKFKGNKYLLPKKKVNLKWCDLEFRFGLKNVRTEKHTEEECTLDVGGNNNRQVKFDLF